MQNEKFNLKKVYYFLNLYKKNIQKCLTIYFKIYSLNIYKMNKI